MKLNVELSRRETEVAHLLAWGASKKEVADILFISTRTVENTARNIYAKVGIQKATERNFAFGGSVQSIMFR